MIAAITIILLLIIIACLLYRREKRYREMEEFTEALLYKDFTRKYPVKGRDKRWHTQFNKLTEAFQQHARDQEAQHNYLNEMLELVDTGIIAYDAHTHEILRMNDAFADMLDIPQIKSLNWLKKHNEPLFDQLLHIPAGGSTLLTLPVRKQTIKVMTSSSLFETAGRSYKLIAFHNISATMEEVESRAWKGLLNVMTHEIMNSIVPVSSLSDTLKKKIHTYQTHSPAGNRENLEDLEIALDTIHRRSEALLRFAETYRSLSQKIVPNRQPCNLFDLATSVHSLMKPSLQQKGIAFHLATDHSHTTAHIDSDLIEQVIINFITNATFATAQQQQPQVDIFTGIDQTGHPYITVADNGSGIPSDLRDKIFIPFFTTKKNGNGIGLSISREIIKQHSAQIHIQSEEGKGSAFTVLFEG